MATASYSEFARNAQNIKAQTAQLNSYLDDFTLDHLALKFR